MVKYWACHRRIVRMIQDESSANGRATFSRLIWTLWISFNRFTALRLSDHGLLIGKLIQNSIKIFLKPVYIFFFFSSWISLKKRENCGRKSVKTGRRFYTRPYFITAAFDISFNNWILISNYYHAHRFKQVQQTHQNNCSRNTSNRKLFPGEAPYQIGNDGPNTRISSPSALTPAGMRSRMSSNSAYLTRG